MSIWEYHDTSIVVSLGDFAQHCIYCRSQLYLLTSEEGPSWNGPDDFAFKEVMVCGSCGWWYVRQEEQEHIVQQWRHVIRGARGVLKNLDLTDLSTPLNEVRSFLSAKYEARFSVHPKLFEETVADVFRDLGYRTRVTGKSGDDGIDVVLDGAGGDTVAVQVKRYRSAIKVEQIRSFAGALVLGGYTKGIYVTTSNYQGGAERTSTRFASRGLSIELLDARKFYEALQIAQRNAYTSVQDKMAPYNQAKLIVLSDEGGYIDE